MENGESLMNAMQYEVFPEEFKKQAKKHLLTAEKKDAYINKLPDFGSGYQKWYSESLTLIK